MILSLQKIFLVLNVVLFSLGRGSTLCTARLSEGDRTPWISATHRNTNSLGQVRPVKEAPAAPNPAVYGHHYVPGQHRPVLTHTTESTTESKSVGARQHNPSLAYPSYAVFIQDLNAAGTTLTTRTGVRSMTVPAAYSYASVTLGVTQKSSPDFRSNPPSSASASATETGAASGLHDFRSVTIAVTRESSVASPQSETLTGTLWTLPACNGPPPGPGLTPVGCTLASSAATAPQPTTTYSWPEVSKLFSTSEARQGNSLHPQASTAAVTSSTQSPTHSQSWTFNSTPCSDNKDFECVVVNGSSTVTLGPISQILGLGAATLTPLSRPTSGNHSQNWTANSKPCAGNKSFECVDTDSGIITLGHKASLKYPQISTSNSTPCADNKSFECVVNGSSTITLGPIASLTATHISQTPSTQTAPPNGIPCAQNTTLECVVQGSRTFTGGKLPPKTSIGSSTSPFQSQSTTTVALTLPPFTSSTSTRSPHDPYPYPRASSVSVRRFKIPTILIILCSLAWIVASIDLPSASHLVGRAPPNSASTSTDINYGPLVTSRAAIVSGSTVPADGNYGIGAPPATTSTAPADGNWGIGVPPATASTTPAGGYGGTGATPATVVTMSAPPPIGLSSGTSTSPVAVPASTALTHAVSGASSSFSPFPTNFIQPVTGSGTEAPEMRSSPPLSKIAQSGSSKTKIPSLLLVFSFFFESTWAGVFPTAPTVEQLAAAERAAQLEAMTVSLPPTSASISFPNHEAARTLVIVQSSVVTVIEPTETTSQGLRRIATPFLLLMLCCIAATLYTVSSQRKRDRTCEGYKVGNRVVYPAESDFNASGYK
ncbi:hypothetical protein BGZ57DRAFT_853368 [Hyaloscypha finlandica]|nr:hypothetical protein BGZ57DRAFT_853368 [Hyaloscypha finlandica]